MTTPSNVRILTKHWQLPGTSDPPDLSVVGTPSRRPSSLRRTAHLSAVWPNGFGGTTHLLGRGRDLITEGNGEPKVRADGLVEFDLDSSQAILAMKVWPEIVGTEELIGRNAIRGFRGAVENALPQEREGITPLAFLLDDVPPVSMIGGIAWTQHRPAEIGEQANVDRSAFQQTRTGLVACSGLRPDGYHDQSLDKGILFPHWLRPAGDLSNDDQWAWHRIEVPLGACFRRRRRMDMWRSGASICIDAHHRDSVWGPEENEISLHEYSLTATIDHETHLLTQIDVTANVLPFPECPLAAPHIKDLIGTDVSVFRGSVHKEIVGLHACTHLNDMVRGLSDVPGLAEFVPA